MLALNVGDLVKVLGVNYVVLAAMPYQYQGRDRMEYTLRRARGTRTYYMVGYENGTYSDPV